MFNIQNQIIKLIWIACFLVFLVIIRLLNVQVVNHQYYKEKTLKQRKQSKNALFSQKYKIFLEDSVFDIEIIPKQLLNKKKEFVFNKSVTRLAELLGRDPQDVWQRCLEKYHYLRQKIQKKVQEEFAKQGGNKKQILREKEEMYLNRPYPLFQRVDKKIIMEIETAKYTWSKSQQQLQWKDLYRGFVIRRRLDE